MELIRKYKAVVILIIGIIGILAVNWDSIGWNETSEVEEYSETLISTDYNVKEYIMVDIKGEVLYPGLYEVTENQRVGDVINIAGGLTVSADISSINLASKIEDEMIIVIPAKSLTIDQNTEDIVKIIVEIKGEVQNPGVYELYQNQRVNDLIQIAGGLSIYADTTDISLVEILKDQTVITIPRLNQTVVPDLDTIMVEIKGEVNLPGIYMMSEGDRVVDLINKAGGLTENALKDEVELARVLNDGESIFIASQGTEEETRQIYVQIHGEILHPGTYLITEGSSLLDLIYLAGGVTTDCNLSKINWNIVLCLGAVIYIPSINDAEISLEENGLININTADLETLITLNGIGQILGQRIIDYRAEYGDFLSIEDIMNVSGIKESIYEQIKEFITV